MPASIEYGRLAGKREEEVLRDILCQAFSFSPTRWPEFFRGVGKENFRVVRRKGRTIGGLGILPIGQWFGGRSVPMGGIAAVGVPPEHRAGGVARTLMARTLKELRADGVPLSALYASTQHLYRAVGYEQAGSRCQHAMALKAFTERDRSMSMERIDPAAHETFHELYKRASMVSNGHLDRNRTMWERVVRRTEEEPVFAYTIGAGKGAEGYVILTQHPQEHGYDVRLRDWAALTPAAHRRLLAFLADLRSVGRDLYWWGPAQEPLLCLPEEQLARMTVAERWLLRIVDVRRALEQRGYPADVEAELHLEIRDELIAANAGRWTLRIAGGQGTVRKGGRGELRADVRGLAPLYSAMLSPRELWGIGWVASEAHALDAAARIFAGPQPWMAEGF